MEDKTNFRGAYRLSGTAIVECLEIIYVRCNLKQFDGLTWLTLPPNFMTDLRHCNMLDCYNVILNILTSDGMASYAQNDCLKVKVVPQ